MEILLAPLEQNHSPGGLCGENKIHVIEDTIPEPKLANGIYLEALPHPLTSWFEINHASRSANFVEEQAVIGGHLMHTSQLEISISKDESTRLQAILSLTRKSWLVRFKDNSGNTKLMGFRGAGANAVIIKRDSKKTQPERNEMILVFRMQAPTPVPDYPFEVD